MRVFFYSILISIICISLLPSCTIDQTDGPEAIRFGQIVGNYTGKMERCTLFVVQSDSVCSQDFEEKLIISISDQKNIYIRTQSELIPRTRLMLLSEENFNGSKRFVFSSTQEDTSHILTYSVNENQVLYTGISMSTQINTTVRFDGTK